MSKVDIMGRPLIGKPAKNATIPYPIGAEVGWLTALKQSATDRRYMIFSCRCGEKVIRMSADVRESARRGAIPACPKCKRKALASKGTNETI